MDDQIIEADQYGHISFSIDHPKQRYRMIECHNGTLVLEPDVMSELEQRFMANTELQAKIEYSRAHPEELVRHKRR